MFGDELSMRIAFVLFLLAFVLIGIYPAWQRTAHRVRNYLNPRDTSVAVSPATNHLDEIEFLLLQRLARSRGPKPSVRRLAADLHLSHSQVASSLASLGDKKLVRFSRPYLSGKRYALSAKGRFYAIEQGFIPRLGKSESKI